MFLDKDQINMVSFIMDYNCDSCKNINKKIVAMVELTYTLAVKPKQILFIGSHLPVFLNQ